MIPVWVQRHPAIWVAVVPGLDARMPPGATVLTELDVQSMLEAGQVSFDVAKAWAQGADVEFPVDTPPHVRALAERLRRLLPEASRPHLAEIGSRFGVPRIAMAMAAHPAGANIEQLVQDVAEPHPDGVPRLSPEARLLRALAGL